jgi:hypothetical protein
LVWECIQALGKLSEFNKVTLLWTHRHQEILGNEKTNRLAKERAMKAPPSQTAVIPFSVHQKLIKRHLELVHQARWDACGGCCQSKELMRYHLPGAVNELLAISRFRLRAAVGLLTSRTTPGSFAQTRIQRAAKLPKWVDMIGKTVYTLYITVQYKHAKDTGPQAACF